jgi:hypothetical protein
VPLDGRYPVVEVSPQHKRSRRFSLAASPARQKFLRNLTKSLPQPLCVLLQPIRIFVRRSLSTSADKPP